METEKLTIGQASGRKVATGHGQYMFLERYDPFSRTWTGNGYDGGPVVRQITNTALLEHGIEIIASAEELDKIETLRLSNRVYRASKDLSSAIAEWLNHPSAR